MMTDKLPKLLKDAIEQNKPDVKVITENLKLPWLKLDLTFPNMPTYWPTYLENIEGKDWRGQWKFEEDSKSNYQVKDWNGGLLFGPQPHDEFLKTTQDIRFDVDEDSRCKKYRKDFKFDWYVNKSDLVRKWIGTIIPDEDLNLVNTYYIPPGGYVFPHKDYPHDGVGLAKIYIAAVWDKGNVFGIYGCGNIPIKQGDVFLLNNYTLPHWVYNGSNTKRCVIDIGANLNSPQLKDLVETSFKKYFQNNE